MLTPSYILTVTTCSSPPLRLLLVSFLPLRLQALPWARPYVYLISSSFHARLIRSRQTFRRHPLRNRALRRRQSKALQPASPSQTCSASSQPLPWPATDSLLTNARSRQPLTIKNIRRRKVLGQSASPSLLTGASSHSLSSQTLTIKALRQSKVHRPVSRSLLTSARSRQPLTIKTLRQRKTLGRSASPSLLTSVASHPLSRQPPSSKSHQSPPKKTLISHQPLIRQLLNNKALLPRLANPQPTPN